MVNHTATECPACTTAERISTAAGSWLTPPGDGKYSALNQQAATRPSPQPTCITGRWLQRGRSLLVCFAASVERACSAMVAIQGAEWWHGGWAGGSSK